MTAICYCHKQQFLQTAAVTHCRYCKLLLPQTVVTANGCHKHVNTPTLPCVAGREMFLPRLAWQGQNTQSATIMSKLHTLFKIYARLTSASTAISANDRCHRLPSLEYPDTNGVTDMNNKEIRSKIRRSFCYLRQSSASDHSSVPQKCCHSFAPQFTEIRYQCVRSYFAAAPGLPIHSTHCEHTPPPTN